MPKGNRFSQFALADAEIGASTLGFIAATVGPAASLTSCYPEAIARPHTLLVAF